MSWSKVNKKFTKPAGWWFNKILCELVWLIGDRGRWYYYFLNRLCSYGYNIYGDKILKDV